MNQSDWYAKLLEWSHTDKRLGRLPYVLMVVLAEHLAERDAAEQSMHQTGLTPRQKEEVEQIVMRALSTGSV